MTIIQSSTEFTIGIAESYTDEGTDLIILPNITGAYALRELHHPTHPEWNFIYPDMPDKWENFDTVPLTSRPMTAVEMTLAGNQAMRWPGYQADRPVKEYWLGSDRRSRVTVDFLRRLLEFFLNPPEDDYITWWPKDRTVVGYQILIESVQLGGQDIVTLQYPAVFYDEAPGELVLTFRIMGIATT